MGTRMKLAFIRGDKTTREQWRTLQKFLDEECVVYDVAQGNTIIDTDEIYRPYSVANARGFLLPICEKLIGSGLTVHVWYEERDPDDTYCFEERQ